MIIRDVLLPCCVVSVPCYQDLLFILAILESDDSALLMDPPVPVLRLLILYLVST